MPAQRHRTGQIRRTIHPTLLKILLFAPPPPVRKLLWTPSLISRTDMQNDFLKGKPFVIPTNRYDDRRSSPRTPLMLTAWVWRGESPNEGLAVRLLDHSDTGVGFISPLPLEPGELFELSLEHDGARRTNLKVAHCEFINENAFRVGAKPAPVIQINPA
jgi:hypothetical protein